MGTASARAPRPAAPLNMLLAVLVGVGGLSLATTAVAQQPTVAVVINASDDVAPIREPVFGALRARNYAIVAPDSVDAAMALALSGQRITEANAPQLRQAVNATVLYLISLQPADGEGGLFFSIQRFGAAGAQNVFGRATADTLVGQIIQQLLTIEQAPPPAPPPALAPQPQPVLTGGVSAAPPAPTPVAPQAPPVPAPTQAVAQGGGDLPDSVLSGLILAGLTYFLGGGLSIGFCDNSGTRCDEGGGLGWIPLVGPYFVAAGSNMESDALGALLSVVIIEDIAVFVILIGGAVESGDPAPAPQAGAVRFHGGGLPGGGRVGMTVAF